jgi:hypothetical protein
MNTKHTPIEGALVDQYLLPSGNRAVKLVVRDDHELKPGDVITIVDYPNDEGDE